MSWIKEPSEPKKKGAKKEGEAKSVPSRNVNLFESLSKDRARHVHASKLRTEQIKTRLKTLEEEIDTCTTRASIHRKKRLEREKDKIHAELEDIVSGVATAEYDRRIEPFLVAARQVVHHEKAEAVVRESAETTVAPAATEGESAAAAGTAVVQRARRKIPDGARDVRVQSNGKTHCGRHRREIVADELSHELEGGAAALHGQRRPLPLLRARAR